MMESVTKNAPDEERIREMAKRAFPRRSCTAVEELTEGYFNAAFRVSLDDGRETVLKIAPLPGARIMSYEKNIMTSELMAMELAARRTDLPVAEILYRDDSCTICPSRYFFMEKLEGSSLYSQREQISEERYHRLQVLLGGMNRRLNQITGEKFGFPGQPDRQDRDWYRAFRQMLLLAVGDARAAGIQLTVPGEQILGLLERDRAVFRQVERPRLVHWDLWDGNVFTEGERITGIIDWERCLWADPLMEVGFRTYGKPRGFLEGYGITELSREEYRRAVWYDVYLMLLGSLEAVYRQYDSPESSRRSGKILEEKYLELERMQGPGQP